MFNESDIEAALLDHDGSCRDINLIDASWDGLHELMRAISADFGRISVGSTSHDTNETQVTDVAVALELTKRVGGTAQFLLNEGRGFVTHLQVFCYGSPSEPRPDIELTFFPQDIRSPHGLAAAFLAWADRVRTLAQSSGYYARYEDGSWKFGDVSRTSGVFFVRSSE